MTNEFWSTDNFKKLKSSLWKFYWDNFLIPAFDSTSFVETSKEFIDETAGSIAAKNWKKYRKENDIKSSKPKIRINPVYYPNSTSVTADEYRYIEEEHYDSIKKVVVIKNPFYASPSVVKGMLNKYRMNNNKLFNSNSTLIENAVRALGCTVSPVSSEDLNEKYIEIPEKLARKILVLENFKTKI